MVTGVKKKRRMATGMRNEAKTVPTTSRFSPSRISGRASASGGIAMIVMLLRFRDSAERITDDG